MPSRIRSELRRRRKAIRLATRQGRWAPKDPRAGTSDCWTGSRARGSISPARCESACPAAGGSAGGVGGGGGAAGGGRGRGKKKPRPVTRRVVAQGLEGQPPGGSAVP